ncbi:DsrE family protein [Streptomyces sp. Rer75]|uniref:DsrE family protein n=1 Tax=unclassified Streptomyces TaxID=2593676 RepID=UPI0015D09B51|nr:DsrE family protein [Streptomyces sp. Rer75]QLH22022.1 DsrE family protein [Streptomyces sp. Rer75]
MTDHLLIESGGPQTGPACERFVGDAVRLAGDGHRVVLFLVENGVTAALPGAAPGIEMFLRDGGEVWVDTFSAAQRALPADDLAADVRMVEMDDVAAKLLEPQVRAVWH